MSKTKTDLKDWQWRLAKSWDVKEADKRPELREWTPVNTFPSVIQMELRDRAIIPNADIGENERLTQWPGDVDWEYRTSFETPPDASNGSRTDLVLEGLDTIATAYLNDEQILKTDNMFVPERVNVSSLLLPAGEANVLRIYFESAERIATQIEAKYGERRSTMRDKKRMYVRKAQYHWGWDWGPKIMTAGPWMPVYLETFKSRIDDVHVRTKLEDDHSAATVTAEVAVADATEGQTAALKLMDQDGAVVAETRSKVISGKCTIKVPVKSPNLWWPNGQGSPHLYTAETTLQTADGHTQDTHRTRFGIRTVEIIQRPLTSAKGKTFMFRVNGRDVFAQGGDWIPADMCIPSISRKRYFDWVRMAKFQHLNMIRVWGGGIYETDDFFDACDEMGILVWLDYAFACGDYSIHDEWMKSVAREAEAQTIRLRNRACLALLCGGNEDFMFADLLFKIDYDRRDLTGPFDDKPFPARKIYLEVLPKIAERLCPDVPYWANSPFGGDMSNDTDEGDVHQWMVWHMEQLPYQDYKTLAGRFVSEFGMHGFPVKRTVDFFTRGARPEQLHPQSRLIDCHNKGHGAHTRIARYLAENFRFDMTDLDNFVYSSQLMQSEALGYALRDWKRLFNGEGDEQCAGAVIWQLNDVYPVTSWAYVDYFLRPKPAFYTIRREFGPVSVGIERTPRSRWVDEDKPRDTDVPTFELFAHNTTPEPVSVTLELRAYDFYANKYTDLKAEDAKRQAVLKPGRNTELGSLGRHPDWEEECLVVLEATLTNTESGARLARFVDWPEPYRYIYWPNDTSIAIKTEPVPAGAAGVDEGFGAQWEDLVTVSSQQPLKGVWLEPVYDGSEEDDDMEPMWEDNMFDVMPGADMRVRVWGLKGRKVHARFLGDWEVGK